MGNIQTCNSTADCTVKLKSINMLYEEREVESYYNGIFSQSYWSKSTLLFLSFLSLIGYGCLFLFIYFDKRL